MNAWDKYHLGMGMEFLIKLIEEIKKWYRDKDLKQNTFRIEQNLKIKLGESQKMKR
jgi:hypothetical protein